MNVFWVIVSVLVAYADLNDLFGAATPFYERIGLYAQVGFIVGSPLVVFVAAGLLVRKYTTAIGGLLFSLGVILSIFIFGFVGKASLENHVKMQLLSIAYPFTLLLLFDGGLFLSSGLIQRKKKSHEAIQLQ